MRGQVADQLIGIQIDHRGADRHADVLVLAATAVHVAAHAVLAALRLEAALVTEIHQRVQAFVRDEPYAAAVATVATVGAAVRNEFLATEASAAVAAVPCLHLDDRFVDKFHGTRDSGLGTREQRNRVSSNSGYASRGHLTMRNGLALSSPEPRVPSPGFQEKAPHMAGPLSQTWRSENYPATTLTVRRPFGPCVLNSTLPSTSAYNVWSRPRPTPMPGWNWVPRWRTMILPASTACPP